MLFSVLPSVADPQSTPPYNSWLEFGTAIAVLAGIVIQKVDSMRTKRALAKESQKQSELGEERTKKLDKIHGLVNGTMLDQKKITMIFAKRIAELTKNTPGNDADQLIAQEAEREYIDHQRQTTIQEHLDNR